MQNLKTSSLLLGFLICATITSAQISFKKGFIVNLQNDTILGLVKEKRFEDLSKKVIFKTSKKAEIQSFYPKDIKGFAFKDGDVFESFDVHFQLSTWETISEKRFLSRLVFGEISLYELTDLNHPFFIKKEGGDLHLLCLRKTNKDIEKEYLEILKLLMEDCPAVIVSDNLPLKRTALIKLVHKYKSKCTTGYPADKMEKAKSPVGRFTLLASLPGAYIEKYGGLGTGGMLEMGGRRFSVVLGFEGVKGVKNKADEVPFNYSFLSMMLRLNYRVYDGEIFSPYVFAGRNFMTVKKNRIGDQDIEKNSTLR